VTRQVKGKRSDADVEILASCFIVQRSSFYANVHPRPRLPGCGLAMFDFCFGSGEVDFPLWKNSLYNPNAPH
jgi:hypothetical protein